jgi:hypothetical protein
MWFILELRWPVEHENMGITESEIINAVVSIGVNA